MATYSVLLPSKARTADATSPVFTVWDKYRAAHVTVDITAGSGINLLVYLKGKDNASGKSYTILQSPILNGTGTTVMRIGPEYTAGANIAKDYVPFLIYADVVQSGGVSATYSIGASFM